MSKSNLSEYLPGGFTGMKLGNEAAGELQSMGGRAYLPASESAKQAIWNNPIYSGGNFGGSADEILETMEDEAAERGWER